MESTVNFNTKLKEAASFGQPITEYDPGSRGYKDFVNLARELMGHTPAELEPTPMDKMTRPQELVQRARQLAQLTNLQFGRNAMPAAGPEPISSPPFQPTRIEPARTESPIVESPRIESPRIDSPRVESPRIDLTPAPTSSPGSLSLSLSRGQMQLGERSRQEPMAQAVQASMALSSQEEEILDSAATPRIYRSPANGNGNGNGNGGAYNSGNGQPYKPTTPKTEEFYGVKKVGDEVIFSARFDRAKKVLIAGDFNNWSPMSTPMVNRGKPGEFYTSLPLRPGRYRYRFVVDGKWMTDPHNKYVEVNQFGELNNVVDVE
jgi:hypothetical protein